MTIKPEQILDKQKQRVRHSACYARGHHSIINDNKAEICLQIVNIHKNIFTNA